MYGKTNAYGLGEDFFRLIDLIFYLPNKTGRIR